MFELASIREFVTDMADIAEIADRTDIADIADKLTYMIQLT